MQPFVLQLFNQIALVGFIINFVINFKDVKFIVLNKKHNDFVDQGRIGHSVAYRVKHFLGFFGIQVQRQAKLDDRRFAGAVVRFPHGTDFGKHRSADFCFPRVKTGKHASVSILHSVAAALQHVSTQLALPSSQVLDYNVDAAHINNSPDKKIRSETSLQSRLKPFHLIIL